MSSSETSKRFISAAVLIPLALISVWLGGVPFAILLTVTGGVMAWELGRLLFEESNIFARRCLIVATILVLCVHFFFHSFLTLPVLAIGAGVGIYLAIMKEGSWGWTIFAHLFCVLPVIGLHLLRSDIEMGLVCVVWLFACIWATDICAYFAGRAIGGPKLAPKYSPNKTWSGLMGGVLGAAMCGLIAALVLELNIFPLVILSGFLAVVAQGGDLLESHLKRRAGVKDSSALIPGHGGVLDRLDGLIAASFIGALIGLSRGGFDQAAKGLISW